jgi:protein TonB
VVGGVVGGVLGGTGKRFEFDENQMAKPVMISGRAINYTDQAIEREVEGTIVVKCVLSVAGAVRDCRVLRGLPFMDRAVVDALQSRRYRPVMFRGQPVEVDYTFNIKLSLPR